MAESSANPSARFLTALLSVFALFFALQAFWACSESESDPLADGDETPTADGDDDQTGEEEQSEEDNTDGSQPHGFTYDVPLAPDSPWPKFRRDAKQQAFLPLTMTDDGRDFWTFHTGKGIFSSPVVDGEGTIYIGSADWNFYALNPDGSEKWRFTTGEIIDSAALLDDKGHLYFGSGDGYLYALNAEDGEELWRFQADEPSINNAFIRWFEGNVAMMPDGSLVAGNDNFFIYAINRDDGSVKWKAKMPDQTWSLAAIDVENNRLITGNNNVITGLGNVFTLSLDDGSVLWKESTKGTIAASPLLMESGMAVLGGYDGFTRSYNIETGDIGWEFGSKDHVYASPALHPEGYLIQASADGTVYALSPESGEQRWAFDWGAPLRSSPAIDGEGHIYVGTGDGYLLVLNGDGSLRWALKLIKEDRDDLNASPALSPHAIYLAGENGGIFGVPFDFCLREAQAENPDCIVGGDEPLPENGVYLFYTTNFGTLKQDAPEAIEPNQALAMSLQVRENGDTTLALIDTEGLTVTAEPACELIVDVSADRRFFTVYPKGSYATDESGRFSLQIEGRYLINPEREGLKFTGGEPGGDFSASFSFLVKSSLTDSLPLPFPNEPGDPAGILEMRRVAAPLPTILPSYNQIGFDSLHFLIGFVEGDEEHGIGWVVEGRPDPETGETVFWPESPGMFPFVMNFDNGAITLNNENGLALEIMNSSISFNAFRVSALLDSSGNAPEAASVQAVANCGDIPLYGAFLRSLGFCNPATDQLVAFGAAILEAYQGGTHQPPTGLGEIEISADNAEGKIIATFADASISPVEMHMGLLVINAETGQPLGINYGKALEKTTNITTGAIETLTLDMSGVDNPSFPMRVYVMVNAYPIAMNEVQFTLE